MRNTALQTLYSKEAIGRSLPGLLCAKWSQGSHGGLTGKVLSQLRLPSIVRQILLCVGFFLTYLLLTRPEVIVIYHLGRVAWYPAIGLVAALLLGISPRYAPLVALSVSIAGRVIYQQPLNSFTETLGAAALALTYAAAAYLLRGPLRIDLRLDRRRDVFRYIFVTSLAAAANTAVGTACLAADHSIPWHDYWPAALTWFLGDGVALFGFAPFLLVHVLPAVRRWISPGPDVVDTGQAPATWSLNSYAILEAVAQLLTIAAVVCAMFGSWGRYHTFFLGFVPVIWIAMRQGMRRVVIALPVLNFALMLAMDLILPPAAMLTIITLFMLVVSSIGLVVGSEVSERDRMAADLNEQTTYLNALIENSPLGIVVFNQEGRVEFANPAFEKLLLYNRRDLAIGDIATLWLEGMTTALPEALAGRACHQTVRQKRRDGKALDLALHAVPLVVKGSVRGVYAIYEDVSDQVSAAQAERKYAEAQSQLVKELQLRTQQMTFLNEMGALLQGCGNVDEASAVVARSLQKLFPEAVSGSIYVVKSTSEVLQAAVRWGGPSSSEASFRPQSCAALQRGQPHWSDLSEAGLECRHLQQDLAARSLCIPMLAQRDMQGMLHLEFATPKSIAQSDRERLRDSQQSLAVTVSGQVALSFASIRLRENLREQAIRDPLTRLFNRRFLEETLALELERADRGRYPVSLLFLDLDHFKHFNDRFGHEAGDVVLRSLAVLLRSFFRTVDVCCRAGGEEFAIILPKAAPENAIVRANALRLEVKNLKLTHNNKPLGPMTVSIGIAAFPDHAKTPEELLRVADRCMYDSKARGRDMATMPAAHAFHQGA